MSSAGSKTRAKSLVRKNANTKNSKNKSTKSEKSTDKLTASAKPRSTSKPSSKAGTANGGKPMDINDDNIFQLMDELLDSSNRKKLTKEQEKKKKELEAYLNRELDIARKEMGVEEEDSEFSEEYTLNSSVYSSSESCSSTEAQITVKDKERKSSEAKGRMAAKNIEKNRKSLGVNNLDQVKNVDKRKSLEGGTVENNLDGLDSKNPKVSNTDAIKKKSPSVKRSDCRKANGRKRPSVIESAAQSHNNNNAKRQVKMEPLSPPNNVVKMNSINEGLKVLTWLIAPVTVDEFYSKYWERHTCLVKRQQSSYFSSLITFEDIDQMLLEHYVEFTKNIDVTSYKNGVRETLNPEGRALPPVVWEHYGNGCSIRLLNPQTFLPSVYRLNATLQEYFHCMVGANVYLTPPNSQGFAPHYDDIEAFVLQIEGRKRWKLYKPLSKSEQWPRVSSRNFTQEEIGKPILEEVLQPGDILYFPRGTIHQAFTEPGHHSLHITLSVYQKQAYADLFEKIMPLILQHAIDSNVEMRRGLPLNIWQNAGIAFSEVRSGDRQHIIDTVSHLLNKCVNEAPLVNIIDSAVDQVAKKFQHEALPPEILPAERQRTIFGSRSAVDEHGQCLCDYEIDLRTNVRLLRANIMRLVHEENKVRIYYHLNNSKEYCERDANYIEIEPEQAGSVEVLIKSYPAYISASQLPLENDEDKISMVTALWECGLLMLEKPLR